MNTILKGIAFSTLLFSQSCGEIPGTGDDINSECKTSKIEIIECESIKSGQKNSTIYFRGKLLNFLKNCEGIADQMINIEVKNAGNTVKDYAIYNLHGAGVFTPTQKELILHIDDELGGKIEYNGGNTDGGPIELVFTDAISGKTIDVLSLKDCHTYCINTADKERFLVDNTNHCAGFATFYPKLCEKTTFSGALHLTGMHRGNNGRVRFWIVNQAGNRISSVAECHWSSVNFTLDPSQGIEFFIPTDKVIIENQNNSVSFIAKQNTSGPSMSVTTNDRTL